MTDLPMTNRDKLTQAAALIHEVMATLNTETKVCTCCNVTHYTDVQQYRLWQSLESIQQKLSRFAGYDNLGRDHSSAM